MKVVCAYLLAVLGGKATPNAADVKAILSSVGVEAEDANISKLLKELEGKDLAELMAEGAKQLASVPSGGGAVAASGGGGGGAAAAAAAPEPEPEEEEEEDVGFDLFA
eukprot:CAMPEP_0196570534 /NCGR_PEP_ID=MMETSP1081-20130531/640_1 /TAXON_ID=36882 /ORGANISM="Pyramimonas amylifera, Strain CCMP720" /LENGTH=107 /DNA_ID=CAMNT_0041887033 /DNA_START=69 /DNA_END=392 /DNA_ORIENTATION=-